MNESRPIGRIEPLVGLTAETPAETLEATQWEKVVTLIDLVGLDLPALRREQVRYLSITLEAFQELWDRGGAYSELEYRARLIEVAPLVVWVVPVRVNVKVYRDHVRELLEREFAGQSLVPGTRAEVLTSLAAMSANGQPQAVDLQCLLWLMREVLGAPVYDSRQLPTPALTAHVQGRLRWWSESLSQSWRALPEKEAL